MLSNLEVFLRKWIGEAFCGALSHNAVLFIWDQCLMLGCIKCKVI